MTETQPAFVGGETLASPSPKLTTSEAEKLARDLYGIECRAHMLTAERDQNLLLEVDGCSRFVMKISNPGEVRAVTDFQTAALCHVECSDRHLPVPRIRRTLSGATEAPIVLADGRQSVTRVVTFLPGRPLVAAPGSARQRANLARCLARLDRALQGFSHPGQGHYLQWDITHLDRLEPLLPNIKDPIGRELLEGVLEEFHDRVQPAFGELRRQVIYNDLNFYNVLVDEADPDHITGIIDFGDIVAAPLVNDVAVAASYQFGSAGDRGAVADFVAAYHAALPLTVSEVAILPALIAARLATTVLITSYRAQCYPQNSLYILRNASAAWTALKVLRAPEWHQDGGWLKDALMDKERL
ncbi:phosphotransferase [Bradyrhizobium jicamae]|uniref:phosphotransferase n=1 Tax=Bradyrhizobium jicamae TaxID=280332 RepID=UPI001BABB857|nr:phosphotransferase [Bradyrhizobium jicamae]MBR0936052.1 phosphotransferase [Bradyrhizobium jicamae]